MYKVSKLREELAEEAKCHWCGCSEQASATECFTFVPRTCFCSVMLPKLNLKSGGTEGRPNAQKLSHAACSLPAVSWGKSPRARRGDQAATQDKVPCPVLSWPLCHAVGGAVLKGIQRQWQAQVAQLNHLSAPFCALPRCFHIPQTGGVLSSVLACRRDTGVWCVEGLLKKIKIKNTNASKNTNTSKTNLRHMMTSRGSFQP